MIEWVEDAACLGIGTWLFFPDQAGSLREAKKICARCPVTKECLAYADSMNEGQYAGIWGGTTEGQRRRTKRAEKEAGQHVVE